MSDDIDFDFDDEESKEAPKGPSNAEFARMRKELKAAQKNLEELEDLRTFKAEREKAERTASISETFREVGLQPEWAEFYQGDEVTPDAVKQWAVTKKFLQVDETEPVVAPTTGFTPTVIEGVETPGSKMYTAEELNALLRTDPAKAAAVYKAGRLKKEEPDWTYQSRLYGRDT